MRQVGVAGLGWSCVSGLGVCGILIGVLEVWVYSGVGVAEARDREIRAINQKGALKAE